MTRQTLANLEIDATQEERLFCILLTAGYSAAVAYKIAFPNSKANPNSASAQASRLINSWKIQRILKTFRLALKYGWLYIPTRLIKDCIKE